MEKKFKRHAKKLAWALALTVVAWYVLAFILAPAINILKESFFPNGEFTFEGIVRTFQSARALKALWNTALMGVATVITVSVVSFFQILVTEYFEVKGRRFLELAYATPLLYGGVSLVTGYKYVYSSGGFATKFLKLVIPNMDSNWFSGFFAVLFVHTFAMTTYHLLFVKPAFRKIDYSTLEACLNLGGNKMEAFLKVALPAIKPSIFSATVLLLVGALNSFAAPAMLGGKKFYMINSLIQTMIRANGKDVAAILAMLLAVVCITLILFMQYAEKKNSYISVSKVPTPIKREKIRNPVICVVVYIIAYAMAVLFLLPICAIIFFSFSDLYAITNQTFPSKFTLEHYIRFFSQETSFQPFLNSAVLSFLAVMIVLVICMIVAFRTRKHADKFSRILEFSLMLPWFLPTIMLVVGMISRYSTPKLLTFGNALVGGFWILPIGYSVSKMPQGLRLVRSALYQINSAHEEAAHSLGAGEIKTFSKIVLPVIMPTLASTGAITFNHLLAEYTISALLYNVNNKPLGILLRNSDSNPLPTASADALVYIVILMVLSAITLLLTRKYRNADVIE